MLAIVPEPENALASTGEAGKKKHAWRRRAAVGRFQLRQSRTASPSRPSPPSATCDGRRSVARLAASVPQTVRHDRTALDSAGEAAPCAPTPSALFSTQRTYVDGAARLQLAVPLVHRTEH